MVRNLMQAICEVMFSFSSSAKEDQCQWFCPWVVDVISTVFSHWPCWMGLMGSVGRNSWRVKGFSTPCAKLNLPELGGTSWHQINLKEIPWVAKFGSANSVLNLRKPIDLEQQSPSSVPQMYWTTMAIVLAQSDKSCSPNTFRGHSIVGGWFSYSNAICPPCNTSFSSASYFRYRKLNGGGSFLWK